MNWYTWEETVQASIPITQLPESIAIISSNDGSVIHDMIKVLERRAPYIHILLKGGHRKG